MVHLLHRLYGVDAPVRFNYPDKMTALSKTLYRDTAHLNNLSTTHYKHQIQSPTLARPAAPLAGFPTTKIGCHGNVPRGIEKLISD